MPKARIDELLARLRPHPAVVQAPVGWWKDAKGVNQPPGSYLDPALRTRPGSRKARRNGRAEP